TLAPRQFDDRVAPLDDAVGKAPRVIAAGALWNRRERRCLGQVEVADGFAEVALLGALDAVGAIAEVDLIEVELENPVLRVLRLDCARDLRLLELADRRLLTGDAVGEDVPRELHRDRREALAPTSRAEVADDRARDTLPVDAGVLVEAFVLGNDERA